MIINKTWEKIDKILYLIEKNIVGIGLIVTCVLVFINALLRYGFGLSMTWAEEISRFIMIWVVFFGASLCLRKGKHVNMDIVLNTIPEGKVKYFIIRLITLVSLIFSIFLIKSSYVLMKNVYDRGQVSPTMGLPMFIVYLGMFLGILFLAKNFLHLLILKLRVNPTDQFKIE